MTKKRSTKKPPEEKVSQFAAIVMGTSAGGLDALNHIVKQIEDDFNIPIIIVQHLYPESDDFIAKTLDSNCKIKVLEANEKEKICPGTIYIAPANYHLLIEGDFTFSLNIDPKVNYSRPSIDVLFESAAQVYKNRLIGVLLTGANNDGARGLQQIKKRGGTTLVQDPKTADASAMPRSAIDLFPVDHVIPLQKIFPKIKHLTESTL